MFTLAFRAGFAGDPFHHWSALSVLESFSAGSAAWLYAGSGATGGYQRLRLVEGQAAVWQDTTTIIGQSQAYRLSDLAGVTLGGQTRLFGASLSSSYLDVEVMGGNGALTRASPLWAVDQVEMAFSAVTSFAVGGHQFLAAAAWDGNRLRVFEVGSNWQLMLTSTQQDTPKSTLGGVSDLIDLSLGGKTYLIATSSAQDGLTSYAVGPTGATTLVDTIGVNDGLWVSGLDAVESLSVAGATYLITASTRASSLSVVRINDLGVLFIEDQINDTLETRFDQVSEVATFSVAGRGFILAGGMDGGLSLFELLPGGTLFHHRSYAAQPGWTFAAISALHVEVVGADVQVFVASATMPGLTQLSLSLAGLAALQTGTAGADALTGTAGHDLLMGRAGNDTLVGGAGDDVLIAGAGINRLTGGAGADIFVLAPGGQQSLITDFQPGIDRIDLGDWGRLYDISALSLRARSHGAAIFWQGESLQIQTADGTQISPASWAQDDFIF